MINNNNNSSGVRGNEVADELARKGASSTTLNSARCVSIAHLKRRVKELCLEEWTLAWSSANRGRAYSNLHQRPTLEMRPHLKMANRLLVCTITQLRLGHGYFGSYLKRITAFATDQCQCGARSQTPHHLLLECPDYGASRRDMKRAVRPFTLKSLLGTKTGTDAVAQFIRATQVATRRWLDGLTGSEGERRHSRGTNGEDGEEYRWGWGLIERE
jgi:hypothetical protein